MKRITWLVGFGLAGLMACSDEGSGGSGSSSSSSSGDNGNGTDAGSSSSSGASGSSSGSTSSGGGSDCTAARAEALQEQSTVSDAAVAIVSGAAGAEYTLYVDAAAGGSGPSATKPRIYVDLTSGSRVDVSDVDARTEAGWDLALKRTNVFTNGGVGGSGQGAAQAVKKAFADVVAADATDLKIEAFFDEECQLLKKLYEGGVEDPFTFRSTLSDWYDYDTSGGSHAVAPNDQTYVVRGGMGALFKVRFESYTATPEGGAGETPGRFLLRVAPLE